MYFSVYGESFREKIIEKSRFLTYVSHVESEEEAKLFLERVRSLHPFATHVCYGFIADNTGNVQRFSDDGEPQGTAGMPILNVLKARKLFETAVAVVRYFGGIKLGAGGLTRAYASSASEGLDSAQLCEYDACVNLILHVEYPQIDALIRFLEREGIEEVSRDFGERAKFTLSVREPDYSRFLERINNCFSGKITIEETGRVYAPFLVNKR